MQNYSDEFIINGLMNNDHNVINYLYSHVGPRVRNMVLSMNGTEEEANDIFQEGIIASFINIKSGKYIPSEHTRFSTYLHQLCKYKWYDVCKSAYKRTSVPISQDFEHSANIEESFIRVEKYEKLQALLSKIGEKCKDILSRFYWQNESLQEISIALNMEIGSVKNGKYRCMQKLKSLSSNIEF